jgi:hypothetical protein
MCGAAASADSIVTIDNIDDQPITNPNDSLNNIQSWGWVLDSCVTGCHVTSTITHNTNLSVDGQSIQFDLNKSDTCTANCYTDTFNFNRIVFGSAANNANFLTMNVATAMDARGLTGSQALEFNLEQDVQIGTNLWARFIYGVQCDFKGGSGAWRVWDGGLAGGPNWVATTIPCVPPASANSFNQYVFNFTRLNGNQIEYTDFFINGTDIVLDYVTHGIQTVTDFHDQLVAAIQLDGDFQADPYTVFADRFSIDYSVPEPSSLFLLSAGAIGLIAARKKKLLH